MGNPPPSNLSTYPRMYCYPIPSCYYVNSYFFLLFLPFFVPISSSYPTPFSSHPFFILLSHPFFIPSLFRLSHPFFILLSHLFSSVFHPLIPPLFIPSLFHPDFVRESTPHLVTPISQVQKHRSLAELMCTLMLQQDEELVNVVCV